MTTELIAIPARIAATLVSALRARAQMAQAFADLPLAQRHMAEVEDAMRWLEQQEEIEEEEAGDDQQPVPLRIAR